MKEESLVVNKIVQTPPLRVPSFCVVESLVGFEAALEWFVCNPGWSNRCEFHLTVKGRSRKIAKNLVKI